MIHSAHFPPAAFPEQANRRGPALGWGISLLVHAMIGAFLWHASPRRPASTDTEPARPIAVWLLRAAPTLPLPAIVPSAAVALSNPALTRAAPGPGRTLRQTRPTATLVVPPTPAVATLPAPATPNDAAQVAGGDAPAFDLAAARSSARALAREDRTGLAARPLRQEASDANISARVQERLEQARRGNCLKANASMNLLANVAMVARDMVANAVDDSGCKW